MLDKPMKALARLFRRGQGGAVAAFAYAHALNQPLMVEPGIGQNLLSGYLSGDAEGVGSMSVSQEAVVAVLDIRGALLSREEVGPCGETPASYEGIGRTMDRLLADESVTAIVLRLDSPGGMASGLFDLADRIFAGRQQKRIVAVVDDKAFSACYGIAAACDEIWISRTGGVGSVGVVSYHVDQSGWDEKVGVKVEYLYAGARKIDGNPHSALSEEARAAFQAEIDRLYDLFTGSVARYLGLSVEAVKATQAGCYFGENAIAAGLAHKLGTLQDALASLSVVQSLPAAAGAASGTGAQAAAMVMPAASSQAAADAAALQAGADLLSQAAAELQGAAAAVPAAAAADAIGPEAGNAAPAGGDAEQPAAGADSDAPAAADADGSEPGAQAETLQGVAAAAVAANFSELCAVFLREGMSAEAARARLDAAVEIRNLCAAAGAPHLANKFALEGRDVEWVRGQLVSARVRESEQDILSLQPANSSAAGSKPGPTLNRAEIFARRNSSRKQA